jgi:hypothetical protein
MHSKLVFLLQAKLAPKLAQLKALEQKQALLEQGLAQYAENDPERIDLLSEPRPGRADHCHLQNIMLLIVLCGGSGCAD